MVIRSSLSGVTAGYMKQVKVDLQEQLYLQNHSLGSPQLHKKPAKEEDECSEEKEIQNETLWIGFTENDNTIHSRFQ